MAEHEHAAALADLQNRVRHLVNAAERIVQAVVGDANFDLKGVEPRLNDHLAGRIEVALRNAMPEPAEGEAAAPLPIDVNAAVKEIREEVVTDTFTDLIEALRSEEATLNDVVARIFAANEEEA